MSKSERKDLSSNPQAKSLKSLMENITGKIFGEDEFAKMLASAQRMHEEGMIFEKEQEELSRKMRALFKSDEWKEICRQTDLIDKDRRLFYETPEWRATFSGDPVTMSIEERSKILDLRESLYKKWQQVHPIPDTRKQIEDAWERKYEERQQDINS